jgi:hypothetical protein
MTDVGQQQPGRSSVLASYADGVTSIVSAGSRISNWDAETPCGTWKTLDLAGHLLAVVRYYLRLLDASSEGRPIDGLPRGTELAEMNARDLAALVEIRGPERLERFAELAELHLRRLHEASWDETLGTWAGLGPLTVGEHTGIAIGEWHVHAWDLARSSGGDHTPADPVTVRDGQHILRRATEPGDPWVAVLHGYERNPDWVPWV